MCLTIIALCAIMFESGHFDGRPDLAYQTEILSIVATLVLVISILYICIVFASEFGYVPRCARIAISKCGPKNRAHKLWRDDVHSQSKVNLHANPMNLQNHNKMIELQEIDREQKIEIEELKRARELRAESEAKMKRRMRAAELKLERVSLGGKKGRKMKWKRNNFKPMRPDVGSADETDASDSTPNEKQAERSRGNTNWRKTFDEKYQTFFYSNVETGESTWIPPPEFADDVS